MATSAPDASGSQKKGDLPAWVPLTPAMAEEDAQRGDLAMRWAVVVLAIMLGAQQISDSRVLVHVKSGQYLAAHGFLPPATDPFSSTAADRPWINLNWLFDLLAAAFHAAGGWLALTVLSALGAAKLAWFLTHTNRRGSPTWWGSVCAAVALIGCQLRLTPQPELVTLVATAGLLWLLERWRTGGRAAEIWLLVPLFWAWAGLDNRMFLGLALLLCYALGETLGAVLGQPGLQDAARRRQLWLATLGALLVVGLHPALHHVWLEPATLYGVIYPEMRTYAPPLDPPAVQSAFYAQFFPVFHKSVFGRWEPAVIAPALLLLAAAGCLALNWRRVDFGHVLLTVGAAAVGLLALHEWALTGLVAAVVATLNGQAWHAANSRAVYATQGLGLLFSRGGRAATVFALFIGALAVVTGHLQREAVLGLGLSTELASQIESFEQQTRDQPVDPAFHTALGQGDLLIWAGQKSFVDHRMTPFTGDGPGNLLGLHRRLRQAIRQKSKDDELSGDTKFWKEHFDKYQIRAVLPRLSGDNPDYYTFVDLLASPDWAFLSLGSATAVFARYDHLDDAGKAALRERRQDFVELAFRKVPTENQVLPHLNWVQLPTFYERYLQRQETAVHPQVREASHLLVLANLRMAYLSGQRRFLDPRELPFDLTYLGIRRVQDFLTVSHDPHNTAAAFRLLGNAYRFLSQVEMSAYGQVGPREIFQLRYLQAVAAYHQSLIVEPDNLEVHAALYQLYAQANRVDLALRELEIYDRLLQAVSPRNEQMEKELTANAEQLRRLRTQMKNVADQLNQVKDQVKSAPQRAMFYSQNGLILTALEPLREAASAQPPTQTSTMLQGVWSMALLEAGQVEEAYNVAAGFQAAVSKFSDDWRGPRALTHLVRAEYEQAGQIWNQWSDTVALRGFQRLLVSLTPRPLPQHLPPWSVNLASSFLDAQYQSPPQGALIKVNAALAFLERGDVKTATKEFQAILELDPETVDRPLVVTYLTLLTGDDLDPLPPSDQIPILFAPEEAAGEPAK